MRIGSWTFTGFDILVLLVAFISLVMAANRGLFRELISISALIVAALVALFVYGRYRFDAQEMISPSWLADAIVGLGSFAITYMICVFLLSGTVKSLRGKDVGFLDRLFGAGFGVARGLLVCALGVMVLTASYREAKASHEFKEQLEAQGTEITQEMLDSAPKSFQDAFNQEEPELPKLLQGSIFYPLLERIGSGIRKLPFSRMETVADKLKTGESLSSVADSLK